MVLLSATNSLVDGSDQHHHLVSTRWFYRMSIATAFCRCVRGFIVEKSASTYQVSSWLMDELEVLDSSDGLE